jgi:hypothetical protein
MVIIYYEDKNGDKFFCGSYGFARNKEDAFFFTEWEAAQILDEDPRPLKTEEVKS